MRTRTACTGVVRRMTEPTYDTLRVMLESRLSAEAVAHSVRVADTAAEIARVYGLDPAEARVAGLLHDWDRETDGAMLMERAARAGLPVTDADRSVPSLLHGPVAAVALADDVGGLTPEVLGAIGAHTYGASEMSPLAKLVYVADVIEPGRSQPSVHALREAVGDVTLDELFARTYIASLMHVVETRRTMHPVTLQVYNRHVAKARP